MKTNIINLIITSVLLLTSGCGRFSGISEKNTPTATPTNTHEIHLAVSSLAPNREKEKLADFVQAFVKGAPRGSRLEVFDGITTYQVAELKIPALEYDSSRARAKALARPLIETARFLRTNEFTSTLNVEPQINLPSLLRTLPVSERGSVILIAGSPWYQPKGDAGFSMWPDQRVPTDDHLLVSPADSPYGLAGYTNRLNRAKVIFVVLGERQSDRADEALRSFWAKAIGLAGGSLVLYTRDLNRALEAALNPGQLTEIPPPPLALAGELAMQSAAQYTTFANRIAIVRIGGDGPVTDHVGSSAPRHAPQSWQPGPTSRETVPPPKLLIETNRTVVADYQVRTNREVVTELARVPEVTVAIWTNLLTNWTLRTRFQTNSVLTTNTVYRTNIVVSTNHLITSANPMVVRP